MSFDIAQFLGPEGPVARRLEGYEPRRQQIEMALAVEEAMNSRGRLLVEAGTGVGKSFAYLLPSIKRLIEHDERVIVATNTISLQEQLMEKDIPLLRAVAPGEFTAVLVKGRGNYLSLRRLQLAYERQDRLLADDQARHALEQIVSWAHTTRDGTLATLPMLSRPEVWDFVQSDSHNCMGRRCPTYDKCFYQAARRRMENGDLLICNHALFFADLALRMQGASLLPPYDHVILDEAHGVEDAASDHFGFSMSESRVRFLLRLLYRRTGGQGFLSSLRLKDQSTKAIEEAIHLVLKADEACDRLFEDLAAWMAEHPQGGGRVSEPGIVENALSPAMKALGEALTLLRKRAAREPDEYELNSYAQRAMDIASETAILIDQQAPDSVYWMEQSEGGASSRRSRPRLLMRCAPIEVGPILASQLFSGGKSVILTSATLATGSGDFSHAKSRLGCTDARALHLGSPFDYAKQVRLIVDRTLPEPNDPSFMEELTPRILHYVRETGGGAFVLFTSYSLLRAVADRLKPVLSAEGFPVLVHGADGPRSQMLEQFRSDERSVLLGTASFWQGVDVRGRALRNVIITRLPFDVPDRPLIKARLERIEERGGNPFLEDQVPRAVIRFKQGFGRLIRSGTDTGQVVVLDPRIRTKPYGRIFLAALPDGIVIEEVTVNQRVTDIRAGRESSRGEPDFAHEP